MLHDALSTRNKVNSRQIKNLKIYFSDQLWSTQEKKLMVQQFILFIFCIFYRTIFTHVFCIVCTWDTKDKIDDDDNSRVVFQRNAFPQELSDFMFAK